MDALDALFPSSTSRSPPRIKIERRADCQHMIECRVGLDQVQQIVIEPVREQRASYLVHDLIKLRRIDIFLPIQHPCGIVSHAFAKDVIGHRSPAHDDIAMPLAAANYEIHTGIIRHDTLPSGMERTGFSMAIP